MDKFTTKLNTYNEITKERYINALNLEKAKHLSSLSEKAEKLRRLYKTRLQEDLRSFIIVHGEHKDKPQLHYFKHRDESSNNSCRLMNKNKTEPRNEGSKLRINKSLIPTWAWPASLRTQGKFNNCSLFYTLETSVPLSTSQIGGRTTKKADQKLDKPKCKETQTSFCKTASHQKAIDSIKRKKSTSNISSPNNSLNNCRRQKLSVKYGPPFTWNKTQTSTLHRKSLSPSSEFSTPRSNFFAEIPKQPSIYPLELQIGNTASYKNDVNVFIRRTQRMQQMLEILIGNKKE